MTSSCTALSDNGSIAVKNEYWKEVGKRKREEVTQCHGFSQLLQCKISVNLLYQLLSSL